MASTPPSSAATSAASIIQTLNAGSGVNWTQLAADLSAVQFQARRERLEQQSALIETRISTASTIRNGLSTLANAIGEGVRTGNLSARPAIANGTVAQVSSPTGTSGKGSYSLEVTQVARAQTLASGTFASGSTVVGAGTLTIRFGATTGSSFAADPDRTALEIEVQPGATLADVANAINVQGAGVTAYVAVTSAGAQLVLKGGEGEANGFMVETMGAGLAPLAWDPEAGGDATRLTGAAQDALFRLDGLDMRSSTNRTGQIAPGLQLTLTGTNAGAPTTITFGSPVDNISSWMTDFVSSLNEIVGVLNTATGMGGELATDLGARSLAQQLRELPAQVAMPNAPAGSPATLADLGLRLERDGTFSLDTARLDRALTDQPAGVAAMFTNGLYGVYATVDRLARNTANGSVGGTLAYSVQRVYQQQNGTIEEELARLADQQEALRLRMVTQFSRTETTVNSFRGTLSFLEQQIDVWNAQRN